ncbi:MAG TPA: SpoIIE family protein phosphatase, partial [Spirochaetota bacterium]
MNNSNPRKNIFRRNRFLRRMMPGIRIKLAFFTGVFISLILLSLTFFNYVHEGKILAEGLVRETDSSLKLINAVMTDMENVRSNILLVEDMRIRVEEKKKDLRKFKTTVFKKDESIANSFRSLGQKLGMDVKYQYHQALIDTYYSVYFSDSQIKKIEKGLIAQLKRTDGQTIDEKEFRVLQSKGKDLALINRRIDSIHEDISGNQQRIAELTKLPAKDPETVKEIKSCERDIQKANGELYQLGKRHLFADRAFRNLLKQYFEYEFNRMEEAGIHDNNIRIISSDRNGNTVYDTGSHIRDGLLRFGGLLNNDRYLKDRSAFFTSDDKSSASSRTDFDYMVKERAFHVRYTPVYRNPASFERINIIRAEMDRNSSSWKALIKKDGEISQSISEITAKLKKRLEILKDKKIPPNADAEYQGLYAQYRKFVRDRSVNFDKLNPYQNELHTISDYYKSEIGKSEKEIQTALKKIESIKNSPDKDSPAAKSQIETIQTGIESLKERIETMKSDMARSTEDIGLSEKLTVQDAFRNIREAALYDYVVLRLGNQPFVFHDYISSTATRMIDAKRWSVIRNWIYNGRSETDIPEFVPDMKNIRTIENGILSYSRSEAEEFMWKLDGTPLLNETGLFSARAKAPDLLHDLLESNITGYNAVIVDKTEGLRKIAANRKTMLIWTGVIVILAIFLAFFFAGFIVRRINGIIEQAKHASLGDLDVTFPERGIDEIEEMGISLNAMMTGLREKERLKGEISAAGEIQKQLLPEQIPSNLEERYTIGRFYRSMQGVGGDYYDFIGLDKQRILFCIGDVSNHGVGPAMVMAMMRAHLHGIVKRGECDLVRIVLELNRQIFFETPPHIFVTFFIGIIDGATDEIEYCSAGHMKPILYRYRKEEVEILDGGGLPIGMDDEDFFKDTISTKKVPMKPGDLFFQYTDGVNEAMNNAREIFGDERLVSTIKKYAKKKPDVMINQIA